MTHSKSSPGSADANGSKSHHPSDISSFTGLNELHEAENELDEEAVDGHER